jgi:SAM-dependent methyltransferase
MHRYGDHVGRDEQLLLSSSFGAAATAYAEHRPDYAQAAVRWALERAPGRRALDLGAGTGKLTATLVARGAEVIAVEPDPAMLAELRRALPGVRALRGVPRQCTAGRVGQPARASRTGRSSHFLEGALRLSRRAS